MNLSGHDVIVGLDLNLAQYAKIRWIARDYSALRAENLFCSYTPSATIASQMALSRNIAARKLEEFAAFCKRVPAQKSIRSRNLFAGEDHD